MIRIRLNESPEAVAVKDIKMIYHNGIEWDDVYEMSLKLQGGLKTYDPYLEIKANGSFKYKVDPNTGYEVYDSEDNYIGGCNFIATGLFSVDLDDVVDNSFKHARYGSTNGSGISFKNVNISNLDIWDNPEDLSEEEFKSILMNYFSSDNAWSDAAFEVWFNA